MVKYNRRILALIIFSLALIFIALIWRPTHSVGVDLYCIGEKDFSIEFEAFPDECNRFLPIAQHGWNPVGAINPDEKLTWQIRLNSFWGTVGLVEFWYTVDNKMYAVHGGTVGQICNRWVHVKLERVEGRFSIYQDGVSVLDEPMEHTIDCLSDRAVKRDVDVGKVSQNDIVFTLTKKFEGRSTTGKLRNFMFSIEGRKVFEKP